MRIVVKLGTSTLTHATGKLNIRRVELLCKVMSDLKNAGHELILVSSGAIAMGVGKMNLAEKPEDIPTKQALAAVGQCELMYVYDKLFGEYRHTVAQVLLTAGVVHDDRGRHNVENTFRELLTMGTIPIVNENDTVETSELEGQNFGDNDTLSALVASLAGADLLILLSDIDGLFTDDPHKNPDATLIPVVDRLDEGFLAMAKATTGSDVGTGGMATKLTAAKIATCSGADMVIANGADVGVLHRIFEGDFVGTLFREHWDEDFYIADFIEKSLA